MRINSITNYQYQKLNKNKAQTNSMTKQTQENLINFAYMDFGFKAGKVKLIKPQFKTPLQQRISNKIVTCFKILPENAKLNKPIIMNIENRTVEFLMDRTANSGLTDVSIKMLDENNQESSLKMSLDKKGQLKTGIYYDLKDLSTAFGVVNNSRNIYYGNATYRLISENDNVWSRLTPLANETFSPKALQRMMFNKTDLQEILSIMANKNYSFLAE